MATAVGLCSKPNTVEFRLLWMTRICGFYFPSDQRRLMLERDAIGPMEKIYVECVYHTGGLESTMGSRFKPQPHLHTHEAQRYEAHD